MRELSEKEQRGLERVTTLMGQDFADVMRKAAQSNDFSSEIGRMALAFAFDSAWGHPGLDRKSKSIATISALIASKQSSEIRNHIKIGLANGLTVSEIEGILVQLTPYVGLPSIASATTAVIEGLRSAGQDPDVKTSEEKGLL